MDPQNSQPVEPTDQPEQSINPPAGNQQDESVAATAQPTEAAPVYQPEPVAPAQPSMYQQPPQMQPQQPVMAVPPQGPPVFGSKSPKKGLIIGIVGGAVGLLVVIIIVVLVIGLNGVSQKDYSAALSKYNDVVSANSTLSIKASSLQDGFGSGTTETVFENDVKAAREAATKVKSENEELGKLKAVRVGEGGKKYKVFKEKVDAYVQYVDDLIVSVNSTYEAKDECGTRSSIVSNMKQYKRNIEECLQALKEVKETPNTDVKAYISKMISHYESLVSVVDKMASFSDPYGDQYSQYSALSSKRSDIVSDMGDTLSDYNSNINKHIDEVDPKDAARDLSDYLVGKVRSK
jgi:hypothetical protein